MSKRGMFFLLLCIGYFVQAQHVNYTVKPGDSRWKMTQDFGISLDSLAALNPHLSQTSMELPVGVQIKIPMLVPPSDGFGSSLPDSLFMEKKAYYTPASLSDQIPFLDSLQEAPVDLKFLYALPFRLDKMNFQDSLLGQKTIEARRDMKLSMSFYTGALLAADSLAQMGIKLTAIPVDTQLDGTSFYNNLYKDTIATPDAVFGPLSSGVQPVLIRYTQQLQIPAVLPVVSESKLPYENAFYPVPKEAILREKLLSYAAKTYAGEKVVLIADEENKEAASQIKELFPRAFEVELIENMSIEIDTFATQLDSVIPNWVFVESENLKLVSSVSSILNANITEKVKIKMFTTNRSKAFDNDVIDNQHLSALSFCFPSFYKNTTQNAVTQAYEERFGKFPDALAIRGFDLTMDMALKMAYKNGWQAAHKQLGPVTYTDHTFYYSPLFKRAGDSSEGYYNQASFIMQYEEMDVKLIE